MGDLLEFDPFDIFGGDAAADAARDASQVQAQYQREALDYLKESEALPMQYRDAALQNLGALYGLKIPYNPSGAAGAPSSSSDPLASIYQSPIFKALVSGRGMGEEAILRNAAATGGLRSGNVQQNLYDYNQQLESNALLQTVGGLQGFAGTPSNAGQIAGMTSGIGQTLAQGITGAAQAQQAAAGSAINAGLQAFAAFSDRRLKSNITHLGVINGHNWYEWQWNDLAAELGLTGRGEGVIADEVEKILPGAVSEMRGYKAVDYAALGV